MSTLKKEEVNCKQCNFHSNSDKKMRRHKKNAHGVLYEFICSFCGKDFNLKSQLRKHQQIHNTKIHKCSFCVYESNQKKLLRTHQDKAHKDVIVDMRCQHCNFEAEKFKVMETHVRESHNPEAKLVSCDKCKFSAFHKPTLEAHKKSVHSPNCELCSYVASSVQGLKVHINHAHLKKVY